MSHDRQCSLFSAASAFSSTLVMCVVNVRPLSNTRPRKRTSSSETGTARGTGLLQECRRIAGSGAIMSTAKRRFVVVKKVAVDLLDSGMWRWIIQWHTRSAAVCIQPTESAWVVPQVHTLRSSAKME